MKNTREDTPARHADVYVFALLVHKDKDMVDPLDLALWEFYVLPTSVLNERTRSQHSITLPSLKKLAGEVVKYDGLADAVRSTVGKNGYKIEKYG